MAITERELIIPALILLRNAGENGLTMAQMKPSLLQEFGKDSEPSNSRPNEVNAQQIIGNMTSHRSLENTGFVSYINGVYTITEQGLIHIKNI